MRHALLPALAFSFLATTALAQSPPPMAPPPPSAPAHGWQGHSPDPAKRAEHAARKLRDALQLRPDQEPALQAFIAAMRPPEAEMHGMRRMAEADGQTLSTPDRMTQQLEWHKARLAEAEKKLVALKTFYAALSPAQQKAFDTLHPHMDPHGEEGGPRRWSDGPPGEAPWGHPAPPPGQP